VVNPFRRREKYIALAKNRITDNPLHNQFIIPAVLSLALLLFIYLFIYLYIYTFTSRHRIWRGATTVSTLCHSECILKNY